MLKKPLEINAPGYIHSDSALAGGPFLDDNADVVELLDGGFDVAADLGAVLGGGGGTFCDGENAAVGPGTVWQGDDGGGEVGGTHLQFLTAGGGGAQQGSLARGAGVGVGEDDADVDGVALDGEEGVGPGGGLVDVDVEALGGQRNARERGTLLVADAGCGLRLVLRVGGFLRNAYYGLLLLAAGGEDERRAKRENGAEPDRYGGNHRKIISATCGTCGAANCACALGLELPG